MAPKTGLTPPNPFTASAVPGIDANPFAPSDSNVLGALPSIELQSAKATNYLKQAAGGFLNTEQYDVTEGPRVMFSPSQNKMFVNGALYDADDFQSAVDADGGGFLDRPTAKRPDGPDWVTVSPETYINYMNSIEDPSLSRLAARNFSIGGSNLKLIAGRAAQFLGAEETGQGWVDSAVKNLYYNQPFQREFTSIDYFENEGGHGAIDWFVANLAQQGPNLIESIAVALAGAGMGAATGGGPNPVTALGGAIFGLLGKQRVKNEVIRAANKYMKGQALNNGERKLLREFSGLTAAAQIKNPAAFIVTPSGVAMTAKQFAARQADDALLSGAQQALRKGRQQATAGGALGLSTLGSYGMGLGDIYGEVRDTGVGNRATAALGAIPYAALETLPEFFLASRIFGISPSQALTKGSRLKRAGKGFGVGGTLEGLTEAGQETILLLGTNQITDAEAGKRLINSFAAGFAIGGPLGSIANQANVDSKQPVNVLEDEKPADQKALPPPAVGEGTPLPDAPPSGPGALPAPATPLALPAPVDPFRGPNFVGGPQGVAPTAQQGELFPDQDLGTQPTAEQQLSLPLPETTQPDRQLTLPLPAANIPQTVQNLAGPETQQTAIGQQLLQAANARAQQAEQQAAEARRQQLEDNARLQRQREFDLAEKARAEQKIQELQNAFAEQVLAENKRLTEQAEQQARQNATVRIPVRPPIQPNLPGISTRVYGPNRLRRGVAAQPVVERELTAAELEAAGQLPLPFDAPPPSPAPPTGREETAEEKKLKKAAAAGMRRNNFPEKAIQQYQTDFKKAIEQGDFQEAQEIINDMRRMAQPVTERPIVSAQQNVSPRVRELTNILLGRETPPGGVVSRERGTLVTDDGRTLNFVRTAFQQPPIPIGGQNAVQVGSTEEVDVRKQTGTGEGVRGGNTQGQITKANRLKKGVGGTATSQTQANQTKAGETLRQDSNQQTTQPEVSVNFVDTEGRTPIEMWNELRPAGSIDLSRLPQDVQGKWAELVRGNAVNADIAQEIYDDSYNSLKLTPAEEIAEHKTAFGNTTDFSPKGQAWAYASQLIDVALFDSDQNYADARTEAIAYLKNTNFTIPQIKMLRSVFVEQANAQGTLAGTFRSGPRKGQPKPWLDFAVRNNILSKVQVPLDGMPDWYVSPMQVEIQEAVRTETQGDILGQDTADLVLKTLRQQQKAGQTIDLGLFQEAYYQALGKKGRQIAKDKLAELQAENSRLLEDIINSHLEVYEYKSFRGYNPVVQLTSDAASVEQRAKTYGESTGSKEINRIQTIYSNSNKDYYMANGYSLRDFFDAQGKLKISRRYDGRLVPDPTAETQREETSRQAEAQRLLKRGNLTGRERARVERLGFSETLQQMDSKEDGNFLRADGKAAEPLGKGEVKLIVAEVLKKLAVKPKVLVVKDKQELQQQHPRIYARAKAARPRDDFDKVNAMGYSVGDQVIVFSDFIKSKESAQFVVNHEALGHFGFRAFMPRDRMNTIFREIYKTDGHVRQKVDELVEVQGMDQMEAVEEVLADKAASLDVTLIDRLKNIIRAVMRAFGKTYDDDLTRYFISQSRRNLRTGGSGVVGAQELAQRLKELQGSSEFGRYAIDTERADNATRFFTAQGLNKNAGGFGSFMAFDELVRKGKYKPKQVSDWINESLEAVQTLDNKARRSTGLSKIFQIFQNQAGKTRRYLSEYEALTSFTHTPSWFKFGKGPTAIELEHAGKLLAYGALYKSNQVTDVMIKNAGKLAVGTTREGDAIIDGRVREELENAAIISRQEFLDGFNVTIGEGEKTETEFLKFDGSNETILNNAEATETAYRIYVENRKAVVQAAVDVLEANILAVHGQRQSALEKFSTFVGAGNATPSAQDIEIFKRIMEEYSDLYFENSTIDGPVNESVDKATTFLREINRALWERSKVDDWLNAREDTAQFQGDRYQDIIASIERLNSLGFNKDTAFDITGTIQNIFMLDTQAQNAEFNAKRTIMRGYVPFSRRGKWQIRMQAYDAGGKPVKLGPESQAILPYFQAHTEADADKIAEGLADVTSQEGEDIFYPMKDSSGRDVQVKLIAQVGKARQSQPVSHSLNLMEFMSIASRLDVNLSPQVRQRVVTALTNQASPARKSLQRSGSPGWDTDIIKSVAEHLETQGHVAGKTQYSYQINDIMLDNRNWKGDPETLARLYNATQQGTEAQKQQAQREYAAYAYKYQYMADKNTPTKAKNFKGNDMPNLGRGEDFRQEAVKLIDWYSNQANIQDSTEDILSGEVGSRLKLYAVLFQLGGSFATAAINLMSMVTHTIPFLGTYNHKTGFGGGFGMPKVAAEMSKAAWNVGNFRLADYDYVKEVANSASNSLRDKHNLSQDEADALLEATAAGVLQAAQFNALVGTSRGGVNSNSVAGAIKGWMSMFSYTEQLNRRATYIAAYKLERDRLKANLNTPFGNLPQEQQDQLLENARNFASNAVNTSQGEYAMYNRPEMARGNILQYIFMYKQFVIISVQLMKHLSPSGRTAMLGMLVLMSGLKGIPFADDLADLIDTLKQKFGIKSAPIEAQIARLADGFIPGAGKFALRGLVDNAMGVTVSTRLGFGDLIPLTGAFKAKQTAGDYWREATNFFGPVYSGLEGMFTTGGQLARYATETVGLRDDTTRLIDIVRDSPVAAFRGLADGAMYLHDGKITRADGTVIDNDVGITTAIGRMLGFYPYSATRQNDVIRLVKQQNAYLKAFKSHYTQAYVKARLDNDRSEMRRIINFINDHNREHRGTEFEIKNFTQSANKSYKSASKNSLQRFKKFAPKSSRSTIDELAEIMGVELD